MVSIWLSYRLLTNWKPPLIPTILLPFLPPSLHLLRPPPISFPCLDPQNTLFILVPLGCGHFIPAPVWVTVLPTGACLHTHLGRGYREKDALWFTQGMNKDTSNGWPTADHHWRSHGLPALGRRPYFKRQRAKMERKQFLGHTPELLLDQTWPEQTEYQAAQLCEPVGSPWGLKSDWAKCPKAILRKHLTLLLLSTDREWKTEQPELLVTWAGLDQGCVQLWAEGCFSNNDHSSGPAGWGCPVGCASPWAESGNSSGFPPKGGALINL